MNVNTIAYGLAVLCITLAIASYHAGANPYVTSCFYCVSAFSFLYLLAGSIKDHKTKLRDLKAND